MNGFDGCVKKDAILRESKIGEFIILDSNPEKGFNFGYVVFIPIEVDSDTTLIVEGANSISPAEDFEKGNKDVLDITLGVFSPIYYIAFKMKMPIVMPLFPRVIFNNKSLYAQMLSRESLGIEDGVFRRVDNQLVSIFNDAKERFKQSGITLNEKFVIDGFSASGKFANRFTLLHPELVCLCIAGGISGWLTLPLKEINGEALIYPVGMGDVAEFNQEKYEQFFKVKQFYYMGAKDKNDPFTYSDNDLTLPKYPDLISKEEMEQLHRVLGRNMPIRWEQSQYYYKALGVNAHFETYEEFGHNSKPATEKIIELLTEIKNLENKK